MFAPATQPQQQQQEKKQSETVSSAEEDALKWNTDCVYFLASPLTCKKVIDFSFRSYPVSASIRVLDLRSQVSFSRFQVSLCFCLPRSYLYILHFSVCLILVQDLDLVNPSMVVS